MPLIGGRFGTKLPPPAATTTIVPSSTVPVSVVSRHLSFRRLFQLLGHLTEMEMRVERLDLFQQPFGEFRAGADRHGRNVVNRFFRIKLGALAARPVENIDQMAFDVVKSELEYGEQPHGARADNDGIGFKGSLIGDLIREKGPCFASVLACGCRCPKISAESRAIY